MLEEFRKYRVDIIKWYVFMLGRVVKICVFGLCVGVGAFYRLSRPSVSDIIVQEDELGRTKQEKF
jgi:hypothetical protein